MPSSTAHKGMARRPSASATHAPASMPNTTKVHRSKDSHYGFVGTHPTGSGTTIFNPAGSSGSPQDKIVLALIKRLISNLPCYSGHSLTEVESDDAVLRVIQSLAELGCHAIDIIVWKLVEELEKLARQMDGPRAVDVLQSQLFLLKVLSVTMAYRWRHYQASPRPYLNGANDPLRRHGKGPSSFVPASPSTSSNGTARTTYPRPGKRPGTTENIAGPSSSTSLNVSLEAPPLDENCALWLISVMILLLRQTAPVPPRFEDRARWPNHILAGLYSSLIANNCIFGFDASLYGYESVETDEGWHMALSEQDDVSLSYSPIGDHFANSHLQASNDVSSRVLPLPMTATIFQATPRALTGSPLSLHSLIGHWAGAVVYLVSAANWNVVFMRIRGKIRNLAENQAEGTGSSNTNLVEHEEAGLDVGDLGLVQHCAMDRGRLIQILQELSSLLVNMKREGQATVAVALRKAIWNWIETFPNEYNEVISGARRLDGAPERVFDLLCQKDDFVVGSGSSGAQKAALSALILPTLNVLMLISHDRMKGLSLQGQPGAPRVIKELQVIETMRKNMMWTSKFSDIAFTSAVESCKAASRIFPDNDVPLRSVASEICDDIKARLFKSTDDHPFYDAPTHIDVALYAEALVAIYRFLPEEEVENIFMTCLEPERSPAVKMSVVKACIILVIESQRLPSSPPLGTLRSWVSVRVHAIFRSAINRCSELDQLDNIKHASSRPMCKRFTTETISDDDLLMLAILCLYRVDFGFFLKANAAEQMQHRVLDVMQILTRPGDSAVPLALIRTFMHNVRLLSARKPGEDFDDMGGSWLAATIPTILFAAANGLLDAREHFSEQRLCLDIAYGILNLFTGPVDITFFDAWRNSELREPAIMIAEIAFLVAVTSADNVVSMTACKALRAIAIVERMVDAEANHLTEQTTRRYPIYDQLGDIRVVAVGRVSHQKRVRKLLRVLATPCPVHAAVWEECYWRWAGLEDSVVRRLSGESAVEGVHNGQVQNPVGDTSMSPEERLHQWQNLTLFLAAFGAACSSDQIDSEALAGMIPPKYLPDRFRVLQDPEEVMKSFIISTVDLLIAENVHGRECSKDALGNELNPRLYGRLFKRLNEEIEEIIKTSEDPTRAAILQEGDNLLLAFFEQFMTVLKLLIERDDTRMQDLSENVDLSSTLLAIAEYIDRHHSPVSSRIKFKLCSFCNDALGRTDALGLRKDDKVRNNLIGLILGWLQSEPSSFDGKDDSGGLNAYDWNIMILRAVGRLLEHLRLQPFDGFPGDDIPNAISRRFIQYQNILLEAMSFDCENPDEDKASRSSSPINHKSTEREIQLRECVMAGLAHLLSANQDIGLRHFIPLGYAEDPKTRAIFCHAMARTLGLGTRFDVSPTTDLTAQRNVLCEIVKGPDLALSLAICEACPSSEVDTLLSVLFNVFDTRATLMPLLKMMVEREVKTTVNTNDIFRGNSMRMRFLCAFAKAHGYDYLRAVLKPLIEQMCSLPDNYSFELDPSKAPGQDIERNQETVAVTAKAFLDMISSSAPILPPMLQELCIHMRKVVVQAWPNLGDVGVGGFLFLRFISPALVDPGTVDIELPKDNPDIRRGLLHIGKIIQALSTNVLFGKELHMVVFNPFIEINGPRITGFFDAIAKQFLSVEIDHDEWTGGTCDETDAIVIHRFVEKHAEKIGKELLSPHKQTEGEFSNVGGKKVWDVLCDLLVNLGPAMDIPRLSTETSTHSEAYRTFMTRNAERSMESVQNIFYEVATYQDKRRAFVLSLSKIEVDTLDVELALCHMFKLLLTDLKPFNIIVDCTGVSPASEVPISGFKFCLEMIPSDVQEKCEGVYVLHPNVQMQRFLRKLYNVCAGWKLPMKAHVSVKDLSDRLSGELKSMLDLQGALEDAANLEHEAQDVFQGVSLRQGDLKMHIELAIGETHIRITSVKVHKIFPELSSKSVDIIRYADVGDIYNVSTGRDPNEFIIRLGRTGGTLFFTSAARDYIVKAIRTAKNNARSTIPRSSDRFSKLSNICATLLNIGLLNMSDSNHAAQNAALQLLSATCQYLEFDGTPLLPSSKAGFIPVHPTSFAMLLSERLASFTPHLTVDFVTEVSTSLTKEKLSVSQKLSCLQYMAPWIKNLNKFSNPADEFYDSTTKLRDCFKSLVELTLREHDIFYMIQQHIWTEIGKLDSASMNIILDEILRAAADSGIGSSRCEAMADTITFVSSINVRGRILARIRKTLNKSAFKAGKSLTDNVYWSEIAAFTRLAEAAGRHSRQTNHHQLFIPEIMHLVTLLAATGDTLVRLAVHGIIINILHSLHNFRSENPTSPDAHTLLNELTSPDTLRLFGLSRHSLMSEHTSYEPVNDQEAIDSLQKLSDLMQRVLVACAGNTGLANVWRARWMSLSTSTAFQLSPYIQFRAFVMMGTLATTDVDDDLLYQMLVALRNAMKTSDESDTLRVISMLRCICNVVPGLPTPSRYLLQVFWLAVALLQSGNVAFFKEASALLCASLETLQRQGAFSELGLVSTLLNARSPMEDSLLQLDQLLNISFQSNFSFSLAAVIFKGIRRPHLTASAVAALRCLLITTACTSIPSHVDDALLTPDALGYFLALLSVSTTTVAYVRLLEDAGLGLDGFGSKGMHESDDVPRVSFIYLNCSDPSTALLIASFIGAMLSTAQGDDVESQVLYQLLADTALSYPETVSLTYEALQDKVHDTFANCSNPAIISAVSKVFLATMEDPNRAMSAKGSASTLGTVEEVTMNGPGRKHIHALEEMNLQGIAVPFQFVPPDHWDATKMLNNNWFPELITRIID